MNTPDTDTPNTPSTAAENSTVAVVRAAWEKIWEWNPATRTAPPPEVSIKAEDMHTWRTNPKARTRDKPAKRVKQEQPETKPVDIATALSGGSTVRLKHIMDGNTSLFTDMPESLRMPREIKGKKQLHLKEDDSPLIEAVAEAAARTGPLGCVDSLVIDGAFLSEHLERLNGTMTPSRLTLTPGLSQTQPDTIADLAPDIAAGVTDLSFGVNHRVRGFTAEEIQQMYPNLRRLRVSDIDPWLFRPADLVAEMAAAPNLTHLAYGQAKIDSKYLERLVKTLQARSERLEHLQLSTLDLTGKTANLASVGCVDSFYAHVLLPNGGEAKEIIVPVTQMNAGRPFKAGLAVQQAKQGSIRVVTGKGSNQVTPQETNWSELRSADSYLGLVWDIPVGRFERPLGWAAGGYYTPQTFRETLG